MCYVTELDIPFEPIMGPEVKETIFDKAIQGTSARLEGPFPVYGANIDKRIRKLIENLGYEILYAEGYQSQAFSGSIDVHKDGEYIHKDRAKLNFTWGSPETWLDFYEVIDESKVNQVYMPMGRIEHPELKIHHYETDSSNLDLKYTYKNNNMWYLARVHKFHGSRNEGSLPRKTMSIIIGKDNKWIGWDEANEAFKDYTL